MTDTFDRLGMNLLLCAMAIPAMAAQTEQTSSDAVPLPPAATHAPHARVQGGFNVIRQVGQSPASGEPAQGEQARGPGLKSFFVTGHDANEFVQRMKERLSDPEQRAALRAEQRAMVVSQHLGVGRVLRLDPATEQKLLELLTDQQMNRLEQMSMRSAAGVPDMHKSADEMTERMNALRDLLGAAKLERYQDFERSQPARYWVSQFTSRLAPEGRLQPAQEDRLIALKQAQFEAAVETSGPRRLFRRPSRQPTAEPERELQQVILRANEDAWRKQQAEIQVLEQQAAAFLTPTQLAELSTLHAQEQDIRRSQIESARAQAGLDPAIPETPEVVEETPVLIEAQLQVELSITVNRETTTMMRTVRNGEAFTFAGAQGLVVEARPAMYEQDWVEVQLNFYEDGPTGRRRLPGSMTTTARVGEFEGPLAAGGSGTVFMGRRGYSVETNARAKVL